MGKDIIYLHNEGFALVHVMAKERGITVPFNYTYLFKHLRNYVRDHPNSITKLGGDIAIISIVQEISGLSLLPVSLLSKTTTRYSLERLGIWRNHCPELPP